MYVMPDTNTDTPKGPEVPGIARPVPDHGPVDYTVNEALTIGRRDLEDRLADLAARHRSPGALLREQRAARTCTVPGCDEHGALMPRGVRCPRHRPEAPDPAASRPPASPPAPPRQYGTATTDPLGRDDSEAWRLDDRTRLPVRVKP